jgi:hypothetical protein
MDYKGPGVLRHDEIGFAFDVEFPPVGCFEIAVVGELAVVVKPDLRAVRKSLLRADLRRQGSAIPQGERWMFVMQ